MEFRDVVVPAANLVGAEGDGMTFAYETARAIDRGADVKVAHAQCSMAKLFCSEMAGRVADRAVQVLRLGGQGLLVLAAQLCARSCLRLLLRTR